MDLRANTARARPPDPITVHVGGYSHSPTDGSYDEVLYAPLTLDFSCSVTSGDFWKLRQALCNPDLADPWRVGASSTWTTTKGRGSIIKFDGTYLATQPFFDDQKVAVRFETLWTTPHSGSVIGAYFDEAYVPPQQLEISESADMVELRISALIYGNMGVLGAFTSGTES